MMNPSAEINIVKQVLNSSQNLNEFKQFQNIKIEVAKSKEIKKKILSGSSI